VHQRFLTFFFVFLIFLNEGILADDNMEKMDAQTRLFLKEINSSNEPELETVSIEEMRRNLAQSILPSPIQSLSIFDLKISNPQTQIPLRIYVPEGKGPFPVYVSMHGGGWVFGSLDSHDPFCRSISEQAKVIVVSIEYRLAPEHKYPAAFNDCCEAVDWVAKHIQDWGGDSSKLIIGGISAGGNLAAAVALKAKEKKFPVFKAQVLICPVMQHSFDTASYQKYADGYFLTKKDMEFFWNQYLEKAEDGKQLYASPLLAPDVSGLPSALIVLAEFDPLYDEGRAYGKKMKAANVPVKIESYPTIHGFTNKINEFDICKKTIVDITQFIREYSMKML
jgi:acetyl esterase